MTEKANQKPFRKGRLFYAMLEAKKRDFDPISILCSSLCYIAAKWRLLDFALKVIKIKQKRPKHNRFSL